MSSRIKTLDYFRTYMSDDKSHKTLCYVFLNPFSSTPSSSMFLTNFK